MRKSLPLAAMLAAAALGAGASSASAAQTVSISDAPVVTEGSNGHAGMAMFTVTTHRDVQDVSQVEYQYATAPGSAGADDYVITSDAVLEDRGTVPCADLNGCDETHQIRIAITPDDLDEPDELFFMHVQSATMTVIDGEAKATIADDDAPAAAPSAGMSAAPAPAATYGTPSSGAYGAPPVAAAPAVHPAGQGADEVGPAVGIVFRGLRGRDAKVRVKCPNDERRCVGRVSIGLYDRSLASKAFRLKGGESRLVKLHLSRSERRTLRKAGFVYLKASAFDAAGNRFTHAVTEQL